ncbi:MAG: S1C family serine protease [Alphaproteobacteria bacterium]
MNMWNRVFGYAKQTAAFVLLFAVLSAVPVPATAQSSAEDVLHAVVRVQSTTESTARSAKTLGTERDGHGVVIDSSGLIVTIGYLVLEASSVMVTGPDGEPQPASVIAYDHNTGFGLLRMARPLPVKPMRIGDSSSLQTGAGALVAGYGGVRSAIPARVVSRRDFAGYWEYLLPDAIFTQPPYPLFGGAALVDKDGRLVGIGSLIVGDAQGPDTPSPGNMFVPINALKPILAQLIANGRSDGPRHPWMGVYTEEHRQRVFVSRLAAEGPGAVAGIQAGDLVVAVAGQPVSGQMDFYRKVWALGEPGIDIPLTVLRQAGGMEDVTIKSGDRYDWLKRGTSH